MTNKSNSPISPSYVFQDRGPVYLFTNENISGTLKTAGDISGARVLTVGASGDHAFESYLAGAKSVDTFDINSAQKNVIELKKHMIKHLEYGQFMDFFFDKQNFFNQQILRPIQHHFSDDLKQFLAVQSDGNNRTNFKYLGACAADYNIKNLQYISNEQNFCALRDKLPEKIPFMHCDISKLYATMTYNVQRYGCNYLNSTEYLKNPDLPLMYVNLSKKYDLVLLSNIFDYLFPKERDMEDKFIQMHRQILGVLLSNHMKRSGRIYFHYIWGGNAAAWVNFVHYFQSKNTLPTEFVARTVDAAYKNDNLDIVLYAQHRQR
ncbi:MAG: DUF3419 family protein [Alphaproteobacteria bacterium]|nr:DUF3419 family protein [Alphaproteobacteria bacterium]